MSTLDLRKEIVLNLKKEKGLEGTKARVVLVLDFSGSMRGLFNNGSVDEIISKILPVGLAFDDNEEVDFYLFHSDYIKVPYTITKANYNTGLAKDCLKKWGMGSTSYAPVINELIDEYGDGTQTFIIFITDGVNDDKNDTETALRRASKRSLFFQFIGIGDDSFPFLEKLDDLKGREVDNASFVRAKDINKIADHELYNMLLGEYPVWLKEAKAKSIVNT